MWCILSIALLFLPPLSFCSSFPSSLLLPCFSLSRFHSLSISSLSSLSISLLYTLLFPLTLTLHLLSSLWSAHPSLLLLSLPQGYLPSYTASPHPSLSPFIYINEQKSSFHLPPDEQTLAVEGKKREEERNTEELGFSLSGHKLHCTQQWEYYINFLSCKER